MVSYFQALETLKDRRSDKDAALLEKDATIKELQERIAVLTDLVYCGLSEFSKLSTRMKASTSNWTTLCQKYGDGREESFTGAWRELFDSPLKPKPGDVDG